MATIADYEAEQIEKANATGRTPVVFIHGLWLLPSSWDRWAAVFEEAGWPSLRPLLGSAVGLLLGTGA
jgi:non-heme chloroperoxidase